jgi:3-hydroxyisobutyrate dehydrogenase and related beta-hydroxyacid dehydrogenases
LSQLPHRDWNEQLKVGFIGLGNVGAKLAGSVLRNGFDLTVRDLDSSKTSEFIRAGASHAQSPKEEPEAAM